MGTIQHLCMRIDSALEHSDIDLMEMFMGSTTCKDGADIRAELEWRKATGDIYLGSTECEGFHPVTGCPGHQPKEDKDLYPSTALIIIGELTRKKCSLSVLSDYTLGQKTAYQDAINLIRKMYANGMEVVNG